MFRLSMYALRMSHTITITTKALAQRAGFTIPAVVQNAADDFILVYSKDGALVVWGPQSDHQEVLRLAEAYA